MNIAIVGSGAMGQLFGAHLVHAGYAVTFVDVSEETIESLNQKGITVVTGSDRISVSARAVLPQDLEQPVDIFFIFTKGFHTAAAISSVERVFHEGTIGVTLQNGLDNETVILEVLGPDRTVRGVTDYPADRTGAEIHSAATGQTFLGPTVLGEASMKAAAQVVELLNSSGLRAELDVDVQVAVWEKLIFNAVLNIVGSVTQLTVGETYAIPAARELADAILEESLSTAAAKGVGVSEGKVRSSIAQAAENHSEHKTSMTVDVEKGNRTEIESIGGAIEQAASEVGVPTPVLSVLSRVVRARTSHRQILEKS